MGFGTLALLVAAGLLGPLLGGWGRGAPPIVVGEIAASSMFMYLSHFQVKSLVTKFFHAPMPWIALLVAIGGGIIFARVYNWAEGKVRASLRAHGGVSVGTTS